MTTELARKVLGKQAVNMTDDEVQKIISIFQTLCESWLDQYEINLLGKRLKEIVEKI